MVAAEVVDNRSTKIKDSSWSPMPAGRVRPRLQRRKLLGVLRRDTLQFTVVGGVEEGRRDRRHRQPELPCGDPRRFDRSSTARVIDEIGPRAHTTATAELALSRVAVSSPRTAPPSQVDSSAITSVRRRISRAVSPLGPELQAEHVDAGVRVGVTRPPQLGDHLLVQSGGQIPIRSAAAKISAMSSISVRDVITCTRAPSRCAASTSSSWTSAGSAEPLPRLRLVLGAACRRTGPPGLRRCPQSVVSVLPGGTNRRLRILDPGEGATGGGGDACVVYRRANCDGAAAPPDVDGRRARRIQPNVTSSPVDVMVHGWTSPPYGARTAALSTKLARSECSDVSAVPSISRSTTAGLRGGDSNPVEGGADIQANSSRREWFAKTDSPNRFGDRTGPKCHVAGQLWPGHHGMAHFKQGGGGPGRQSADLDETENVGPRHGHSSPPTTLGPRRR